MLVLSLPAIYSLELTSACNNRCVGCSNVYAAHRSASYMPLSMWKRLIADIAPGAAQIRLTGGEPTLHPDLLHILEFATSYDAVATLFTNGLWHNPEQLIRQLQGWPNFAGLLISLHGASPESHEAFTQMPGSFAKVLASIGLAIENGINVTLSTIITHQSWKEINAVVELAEQLGVPQVTFARYLGRPLPEIEPTLAELQVAMACIKALWQSGTPIKYGIEIPQCYITNHSKGCLAGVAFVTIDPWGNVRPCAHSPTIIGSLHEHSMHDLWHSDKMNAWRALMPQECTTCAAYSVCHGGCRAVQELCPDGRDPLRGEPLTEYTPPQEVKEIPASARPLCNFRVREEDFGYVLLGMGQVVPVAREALAVLEACDGATSFAQLAERFGEPGLDLLGELWELGMLDAA